MTMSAKQRALAGEDLAAAAAYIREHGWMRGSLESVNGKVCALGGIFAVTRGSPQNSVSAFEARRGTAARAMRAIELMGERIKECFPKSEAARFEEVGTQSIVWRLNDGIGGKNKALKVLDGGCES